MELPSSTSSDEKNHISPVKDIMGKNHMLFQEALSNALLSDSDGESASPSNSGSSILNDSSSLSNLSHFSRTNSLLSFPLFSNSINISTALGGRISLPPINMMQNETQARDNPSPVQNPLNETKSSTSVEDEQPKPSIFVERPSSPSENESKASIPSPHYISPIKSKTKHDLSSHQPLFITPDVNKGKSHLLEDCTSIPMASYVDEETENSEIDTPSTSLPPPKAPDGQQRAESPVPSPPTQVLGSEPVHLTPSKVEQKPLVLHSSIGRALQQHSQLKKTSEPAAPSPTKNKSSLPSKRVSSIRPPSGLKPPSSHLRPPSKNTIATTPIARYTPPSKLKSLSPLSKPLKDPLPTESGASPPPPTSEGSSEYQQLFLQCQSVHHSLLSILRQQASSQSNSNFEYSMSSFSLHCDEQQQLVDSLLTDHSLEDQNLLSEPVTDTATPPSSSLLNQFSMNIEDTLSLNDSVINEYLIENQNDTLFTEEEEETMKYDYQSSMLSSYRSQNAQYKNIIEHHQQTIQNLSSIIDIQSNYISQLEGMVQTLLAKNQMQQVQSQSIEQLQNLLIHSFSTQESDSMDRSSASTHEFLHQLQHEQELCTQTMRHLKDQLSAQPPFTSFPLLSSDIHSLFSALLSFFSLPPQFTILSKPIPFSFHQQQYSLCVDTQQNYGMKMDILNTLISLLLNILAEKDQLLTDLLTTQGLSSVSALKEKNRNLNHTLHEYLSTILPLFDIDSQAIVDNDQDDIQLSLQILSLLFNLQTEP